MCQPCDQKGLAERETRYSSLSLSLSLCLSVSFSLSFSFYLEDSLVPHYLDLVTLSSILSLSFGGNMKNKTGGGPRSEAGLIEAQRAREAQRNLGAFHSMYGPSELFHLHQIQIEYYDQNERASKTQMVDMAEKSGEI